MVGRDDGQSAAVPRGTRRRRTHERHGMMDNKQGSGRRDQAVLEGDASDSTPETAKVTRAAAGDVRGNEVTMRQAGARSVSANNLTIRQGGAMRAQAGHL